MAESMERRTFVKVAAGVAGAAAFGGMTYFRPSKKMIPRGKKKGHHGHGRPKFQGPLSRAKIVETAPPEEEALAKFIVVSDTHLDLGYQPYVDRVQNLFEDIAAYCSDADAIVINGDITNHGYLEEYEKVAELAEKAGFAYPDDFILVIGNHDQYDSTEGAQAVSNLSDRFREQAGISNQIHPYYERTVCGVHCLMMGPDRYPDGNWAHFGISEEQVDWLDKLALEDKNNGTLTFVFLHEPLYKTVRNTMPGDFGHEWSLSSEENDYLHEHIRHHENVVFFTGHTHAMPDVVQLDGEDPIYVGTGSIGYCVDDVDDDTSGNADISEYGSLGWEVTVWEQCVRFRMRDFLTHTYLDLGGGIYQF